MNSAIVYASNCILGIIMALFCMLTLKMRWGRAVTFIGAYAVVLFSFFGLLLLPDQNIAAKQTVGFLIDLIGFRIIFTDKMPRLAICTFTIFMNEWICEFISFSFFSNVYPQTTQGDVPYTSADPGQYVCNIYLRLRLPHVDILAAAQPHTQKLFLAGYPFIYLFPFHAACHGDMGFSAQLLQSC